MNLDLTKYGFENVNVLFENGLFEHTSDDPKQILKEYMDKYPDMEFIFNELNPSQFYIDFKIYGRKKDNIE